MNITSGRGVVLFSAEVPTIKDLVVRAVAERADLYRANLQEADLREAKLPPPTVVLLASWRDVSEQLCADLMEYDCWNHGDRAVFDNYAVSKNCPFENNGEQRAANFYESAEIWAKGMGKLCSPRDLMLRLFVEKNIAR